MVSGVFFEVREVDGVDVAGGVGVFGVSVFGVGAVLKSGVFDGVGGGPFDDGRVKGDVLNGDAGDGGGVFGGELFGG